MKLYPVLRSVSSRLLLSVLLISALPGCAGALRSKSGGDKAGVGYSGHGAASVDAKTLAEFAPPPLPKETAAMVRNMMEIHWPGMGELTPDGKTLFFGWRVTGVPQVWRMDGPMKFPVQMTSGSDATYVSDVTPDGQYLVLSRDRAGEENPGLYLQKTSGGKLIEIQHKKDVRTRLAWITNDGETIYYTSNDIEPDSNAIYSYSIPTGKKELLFSKPGLWFVSDVKTDDRFLLGKQTGSRTREYYEWNKATGELVPVIGQDEKEQYSVQFAAKAGEYFVKTPKFGEYDRLYLLKAGKLEPVTKQVDMELSSFSIDFSRRFLYLHWNDGGRTRLEALDARTLKPLKLPEFKGAKDADHVVVGRISRYGRYATIGVTTSTAPRADYVLDWKTKSITQWVRPSLPEVDTSNFQAAVLEHYPTRDGAKIPMWVTRPKVCAADPCPVVVHFHGGPEAQSQPGFGHLTQIFVAAGFVFVAPNVRGSEGYGKTWLGADDGPKRLQVIGDIEDAAKHIKTTWAKSGKVPRIGVMGWSYGGYSTLMAMSRFAGSYDAGVALVGMSNLRSFLLNTAPYRRSLRITEYGDPEKDKQALEELSPTSYLDRIKDPLLIIQGVSDPRVPAGEAIQLHRMLKARGVHAPLILFGDEGHGTVKVENKVLEIGHALLFFKENLLK